MAPHSRTQFPNQAESPLTFRLDPSGPTEQKDLQTFRLYSDSSAFVAYRTNQAKGKDKLKVPLTQLTPKN